MSIAGHMRRRPCWQIRPGPAFAKLWDTLHGSKPGEAWEDNPQVVAIEYSVHRGNIDGGSR